MKKEFTPILVVAAIPHDGGIRFLHRENQLDVDPKISSKIWKILEHCNGYNNLETISRKASLSLDEVMKIVSELIELEIVVDSKEQYMHFHKIRNYPAVFNCNLTQKEIVDYTKSPRKPVKSGETIEFFVDSDSFFSRILPTRRSCRNFSDKRLTVDQIGNICHYAYSIKDHAVPSGGALYPLKIYILIEKDQEGIRSGYYEYDVENDKLVLFNEEVDEEQLKYCYDQEEMPFGSSVQIVIAAD